MNNDRFDEINEAISSPNFGSYTESAEERHKKMKTVELVKEALTEELQKRKIAFSDDVIDVYPTCIKVEKETLEYPMYREAVDAVIERVEQEYGIKMELYSF